MRNGFRHTFKEERQKTVPTPLSELATLVDGNLIGDGTILISQAEPLDHAGSGCITFLDHKKYLPKLEKCRAAAVVASSDFAITDRPVIQVNDPLWAFLTIVRHFRGDAGLGFEGIDPRAAIHRTASVGAETHIAPFAVVGENTKLGRKCAIHSNVVIGRNCRIGDEVVLYPGVVLYDDTILGNRVIIHANSVIGADGFGYRVQDGRHVKVPQLGHVEIGDDVEVGACTTIDRGTFQATTIGAGSKIDNLVQVAHNCQIGQHNLLVAQMGIAGSSTTGDYVVAAGQVGIADHIHIGAGAQLGAKAGVMNDIPAGQRAFGAPALPEHEQKRIFATIFKLPEMRRDLRKILNKLGLRDDKAA